MGKAITKITYAITSEGAEMLKKSVLMSLLQIQYPIIQAPMALAERM